MGALDYIGYVIAAALFISIVASIYLQYTRGVEEQQFMAGAEELAERLRGLASQTPGTVWYYQVKVPSWGELRFEQDMVVVIIENRSENFPAGIFVSGPTIRDAEVNLMLERTENGIEVKV